MWKIAVRLSLARRRNAKPAKWKSLTGELPKTYNVPQGQSARKARGQAVFWACLPAFLPRFFPVPWHKIQACNLCNKFVTESFYILHRKHGQNLPKQRGNPVENGSFSGKRWTILIFDLFIMLKNALFLNLTMGDWMNIIRALTNPNNHEAASGKIFTRM